MCKPFSAFADGYVASEGAVAIVIQKAATAKVAPYCRIRGSAIGQDGRSHGFYAPNPIAQSRLIKNALEKSNCTPDDIAFLEGQFPVPTHIVFVRV